MLESLGQHGAFLPTCSIKAMMISLEWDGGREEEEDGHYIKYSTDRILQESAAVCVVQLERDLEMLSDTKSNIIGSNPLAGGGPNVTFNSNKCRTLKTSANL